MPSLETLTEADLSGLLYAASLRRARGYLAAVLEPARSGQTLTARVRGTHLYRVEIEVRSDAVRAHCTCPYDWGGYCKHIGAVLLKWIQSPDSFALGQATPDSPDGDQPPDLDPVELPPPHLPQEMPHWLAETFDQRQDRWIESLEAWLSQLKVAELRQLIKNRGWNIKGTRKADLARAIASRLSDAADTRRTVQALDHEHRLILRALLCLCGGSPGADDLQRVTAAWGALGSHKRVKTYTRHLCDLGLALPGHASGDQGFEQDSIPFSLGRHLPPLLDNLVSDLPADIPATNLHLADPFALVRTANVLTRQLEQNPEPLRLPMPRPRLASLARLVEGWDYDPAELPNVAHDGRLGGHSNGVLTVPPPARLLPDEAIERLAQVAGGEAQLEFTLRLLLEAGIFLEGSPLTVWNQVRGHFLQHDDLAQRAILARSFFLMSTWSAFWEILRAVEELQIVRTRTSRYHGQQQLWSSLSSLRHRTLWVLASLPDGSWVEVSELLLLMRSLWPNVDPAPQGGNQASYFMPSIRHAPWYLVRGGSRLHQDSKSDWDLIQGNYLRLLITGPLHWLGLADFCQEGQVLVAFRLHGLGDLFWDRVEAPASPPHVARRGAPGDKATAITIDDESICVDPAAVSAQAHSLLDQIARLELVEASRLVYRLDPEAAYQAFEAGASLAQLLDGWAQLLPIPMPDQIRSRLASWWDAYGQVRIYEDLTVIEFGDDYALAEVKAVTSLQDHLYAQVSPRLVMVRAEAVPQLIVELENAGYTPRQAEVKPA